MIDKQASGSFRRGRPVALWGYSGGVIATSWAAELQPCHAPELNAKGLASRGISAATGCLSWPIIEDLFAGLIFAAIFGTVVSYLNRHRLEQNINPVGAGSDCGQEAAAHELDLGDPPWHGLSQGVRPRSAA
ncbi:lipase family protein [Nocardia transvalensis]|uniref:lipase family protein n=1 Tax=Nocardia transvalensis TaxID=37333 RepID=UPI001E3B7BF1|nr:lipase family protein [Nocardia transvalensis]